MEDSSSSIPPSFWSSIQSWFTPTILFIFLNLMIATILFTSNLPNHNKQPQQQDKDQDQNKKPQNQNEPKLTRSPSILHLLRSYNLHPQTSLQPQEQEPLVVAATQFVFNHSSHEQQLPLEQDPKPISINTKSTNLDPTRSDLNRTITNEAVFNHSHPHEQHLPLEQDPKPISINPKSTNLDPTRSDVNRTIANKVELANENLEPTRPDFNLINEGPVSVPVIKAQTHFVYDNHTIEKVTAHFHYEPARIENEIPPDPEEADKFNSLDEIYSKITDGHVNRTKSDTLPASGEIPVKLPAKMKKSASMKSAFSHFEEENIVEARRPETVRERRSTAKETADDDVEVDAKADDFINKFKNQLKLQRMDSIIRYKEMVNRGNEK
ncbi:pathogen-associated molecular patterns-induced protein A70-like [Rutidosis leptorrhynchoides]|uniref:pathogen-associated molecular patterns-induced protein A70-like n=1 Tax=Rutidosis leptorrhynchoides TaxID=125765 RepID=UPI003A99BD57